MAASLPDDTSLAHLSTSVSSASVVEVEPDGSGDVAGPQLGQGLPFGLVALSDVLVEGVHDPAVAFDQGPHGPTHRHGTELAVVTDHDHLGASQPGLVEQE
jgi:hypothetical protein